MKKLVISTFIIILISSLFTTGLNALNSSFPSLPMEENEALDIYEQLNIKQFNKEPETFKKFSEIAIREDGGFALKAKNDVDLFDIYVFNAEGKFEYYLQISYSTDFAFEFDSENILIIDRMTKEIISLDKDGKLADYAWMDDNYDDLDTYLALAESEKSYGEYTYSLKNNGFITELATSYKKVVRTDKDGNKEILFDCSKNSDGASYKGLHDNAKVSPLFYIISVPIVLLVNGLVVFIIVFQIRKRQKIKDRNTGNGSMCSGKNVE